MQWCSHSGITLKEVILAEKSTFTVQKAKWNSKALAGERQPSAPKLLNQGFSIDNFDPPHDIWYTLETFLSRWQCCGSWDQRSGNCWYLTTHGSSYNKWWKYHRAERLRRCVPVSRVLQGGWINSSGLLWYSSPHLTILNRNHWLSSISASHDTMACLFHRH